MRCFWPPESLAPRSHLRLVTLGQAIDECVDVGGPSRRSDLLERRGRAAICDVLAYRAVEQVDVLLNEANRLAQALLRDAAHVLAVDGDRALPHVIEARQQAARGRLAAS